MSKGMMLFLSLFLLISTTSNLFAQDNSNINYYLNQLSNISGGLIGAINDKVVKYGKIATSQELAQKKIISQIDSAKVLKSKLETERTKIENRLKNNDYKGTTKYNLLERYKEVNTSIDKYEKSLSINNKLLSNNKINLSETYKLIEENKNSYNRFNALSKVLDEYAVDPDKAIYTFKADTPKLSKTVNSFIKELDDYKKILKMEKGVLPTMTVGGIVKVLGLYFTASDIYDACGAIYTKDYEKMIDSSFTLFTDLVTMIGTKTSIAVALLTPEGKAGGDSPKEEQIWYLLKSLEKESKLIESQKDNAHNINSLNIPLVAPKQGKYDFNPLKDLKFAAPPSVTDDAKLSIEQSNTNPNTNPPSGVTPTYLPSGPITPYMAAAPTLSLTGAVFGDILVSGNVRYGVAVQNVQENSYLTDPDGTRAKRADLVVFRIENGNIIKNTIGQFYFNSGIPQAAIGINDNNIAVFFNHKTLNGSYAMDGNLLFINKDSMSVVSNNVIFNVANWGWAPVVVGNSSGFTLQHFSFAGYYWCSYASCIAPINPNEWFLSADSAKSFNSSNIFSTYGYPSELPSDVVLKRLTGETTVTGLGNYNYLSWGKWNDGNGITDTIYTNSYWIAGSLTPETAIPVTGTATYSGQVFGKLTESGTISTITGTNSLTANFANKTLTGSFDMNKNNAAWTTATVNATFINGNRISGSLAATNGMNGSVAAGFFGPAVNQVGGSWNLRNNNDTNRATGIFVGNKQ